MAVVNDKKVIYINYCDGFDPIRVKTLMAIITDLLLREKPDIIYFLISSNGGVVDSGVTFYNFLKSLPTEIVMHNIGVIDSIANVVFVAGSRRFAAPHTTFTFHGAQVGLNTGQQLSLPAISEIKDRLDHNHKTIAGIICENTKLEKDQLMKLFAQGEVKETDFALQEGIIHEIKPAQVPKDAPIISVNINT